MPLLLQERIRTALSTGQLLKAERKPRICRTGYSNRFRPIPWKRSTVLLEHAGNRYLVSLGTPPIVMSLCTPLDGLAETVRQNTEDAAKDGSRAIAVAIKDPIGGGDEHGMSFIGVLVLADPLRADAKETLRFLKNEGVDAIMVTGDTKETALHVAKTLGLSGSIVRRGTSSLRIFLSTHCSSCASAEVMPEDKLAIVTRAQERIRSP